MGKLRLYRVDTEYIKYLWENADRRVQYKENSTLGYNERRPYIGVVISIGQFRYFAPLENPRKEHKALKANPHILKIDGGKYGLIAFGNMVPIPETALVEFDINGEEGYYKNILLQQSIFCRKNETHIYANAKKTYEKVTKENVEFFVKTCCDFKVLENTCKEYIALKENASKAVRDDSN